MAVNATLLEVVVRWRSKHSNNSSIQRFAWLCMHNASSHAATAGPHAAQSKLLGNHKCTDSSLWRSTAPAAAAVNFALPAAAYATCISCCLCTANLNRQLQLLRKPKAAASNIAPFSCCLLLWLPAIASPLRAAAAAACYCESSCCCCCAIFVSSSGST